MGANQPDICTPYPRLVPGDPQLFLSPHRPIEPPAPRSLCYRRTVWVAVLSGCRCRLGPRQVPDSHFPTFLLGRWLTTLVRLFAPCCAAAPKIAEDRMSSLLVHSNVYTRGSNTPRTCVQVSESKTTIHECKQNKTWKTTQLQLYTSGR